MNKFIALTPDVSNNPTIINISQIKKIELDKSAIYIDFISRDGKYIYYDNENEAKSDFSELRDFIGEKCLEVRPLF